VNVRVHWDVERDVIADEEVVRTLCAALDHGGRQGLEVDVILVDAPTLADLHARFLGDPSETDVIAFDLGEEGGEGPAAEIYVSLDRARSVARARGGRVEREVALYIVHGALHLCGFDDRSEEDRGAMRAAEACVLGALGHPAESGPHELD
jgi:probable rRNA maturation factor